MACLMARGDLARCGRVALAADELADHLVDGWGVGDGADAFDRCGYVVGELRVFGMGAVDEDDVGDEAFGFADLGEGFDAERLGFVAGGDERAGVGHGAADADGLAAILRMELLLNRREEAVEIDVQEAEEVGLSWGAHASILFALCSPAVAGERNCGGSTQGTTCRYRLSA